MASCHDIVCSVCSADAQTVTPSRLGFPVSGWTTLAGQCCCGVCVYVPVSCYCTASKRRLGLRSVKPTQPPQLHRCLVPPLHGNRLFISFLACPPIAHPASVTATGPHQARPVEMGCVKSRYLIRIEVGARNRAYRSIFLFFFCSQ